MAPQATAARKRKISHDGTADIRSAKKSPLAGLPQNKYVPPNKAMSGEQLQAWRKEQRRERNRQSAAESRNKTKLKIEQLEGEVQQYKSLCESMQAKMEMMEQQIRMLTASAEQQVGERCLQPTVTPPTSYPNSPSSQESNPNQQLPLFPPLLSSPADCTPIPVPSQPDMDAAATVASLKTFIPIGTKEHLTISRQA